MSTFPLLFCLSLEPLAQAIRKSEVSIKIHDHNHSISLYADDIILYLDHFDVSVSSIIKEFDHFSSLSGYKINWSKSALMPINNVKVNFSIPSFIPIKESFIYLGITIYKNIHKIARDNFNNILVKVKNDIQRWKNLKVSLQRRISTVNSFPAIDKISRQLRDNASPPKTSIYGNPCSRYIMVRKALAHVLNELRDFRVLRVRIQDDRHEWKDQRTCRSYICRSCFDHF